MSIHKTLDRLSDRLSCQVSTPGQVGYADATAIWSKASRTPRAVVHCRTVEDVQSAVRAARDCDLPLSVRGGGHDWAGRALCDGVVIDMSRMNGVAVISEQEAQVSGGARALDLAAATQPLGLAAVTGAVGAVGMAGFTMGGGYGSLIGRFGLARDNLPAAEIVLADGQVVVASPDNEGELFWALRGGGGNFGAVTSMRFKLHRLPSVRTGVLFYPFSEARAVLDRCADIADSAPDELSMQVGAVHGPDGSQLVFVSPTWCGAPQEGETRTASFLKLGTLLMGAVETMSYRDSLSAFDAFVVNGRREFMETCWMPTLSGAVDPFIAAMEARPRPVARSSLTSSKASRHAFRMTRRPSVSAANTCSSRFSPPAAPDRTWMMRRDTDNGRARHGSPLTRSRFLADIQTFSPATTIPAAFS